MRNVINHHAGFNLAERKRESIFRDFNDFETLTIFYTQHCNNNNWECKLILTTRVEYTPGRQSHGQNQIFIYLTNSMDN